MRNVTIALAFALAATSPALAEGFTAKVNSVTPGGIITFDDNSQMMLGPDVTVSGGQIAVGATVSVDVETSENGYDKVKAIEVQPGQ
jgi:hypothetical protein